MLLKTRWNIKTIKILKFKSQILLTDLRDHWNKSQMVYLYKVETNIQNCSWRQMNSIVLTELITWHIISKRASLTGRPTTSEKPHFGPNFGLLCLNWGHKTFFEVSVRYCLKLQSYEISRKTNSTNLGKWQKT